MLVETELKTFPVRKNVRTHYISN